MIDPFSRAVQKITELGVPVATVATLSGISSAKLCQLFGGQRECSNADALRIWNVVQMLDQLVEELKPVPVDYGKAIILRDILARRSMSAEK